MWSNWSSLVKTCAYFSIALLLQRHTLVVLLLKAVLGYNCKNRSYFPLIVFVFELKHKSWIGNRWFYNTMLHSSNWDFTWMFHSLQWVDIFFWEVFLFLCTYIRGFRWLLDFYLKRYQDIVKATASWVFEDLKFKISEGSDQNWSCPESAQLAVSAKLRQLAGQTQDNFNFGLSLLKF